MIKMYAEDPIKSKVLCGDYDKDRNILVKKVKREKHYFNLVKGYAIQIPVFNKLRNKKIKGIEIHETDTDRVLYADIDTWWENGGIWTGRNGSQRTLSEKFMIELKGANNE